MYINNGVEMLFKGVLVYVYILGNISPAIQMKNFPLLVAMFLFMITIFSLSQHS
jgi:hypothetical protein